MRRTPALIVGGGPAGAATAITLARAGASPVLVERSIGDRDVVCGGFLGWDALAALKRLGLDVETLGASPIHRLRLVAGRRVVERALPQAAAGLSRRRLDSALLRLAEGAGAVVHRGRAVRALDGLRARLDDDEEMAADAIFLATGKHELRGAARDAGGRDLSVGLRTALAGTPRLARALAGTIELHLYDGGYAGLLVQEDESVNLCLSLSRRRMAEAGSHEAVIESLASECPLLADRLEGGSPANWEAVAGVPYGWRARRGEKGLFRVGDQAAVIASLAGDGIAIALTSAGAAAQAFLAGGPDSAGPFQAEFARQARRPLAVAEALRGAAERRLGRRLLVRLARLPGLAAAAARWTRIA
ncbi:MAG TPA: FAD-dependent monooxygenase [Allosphingosinicella sp.]|nr:FAD-dependent monooxygenase [Allosphingosinicella sp.]